MTMCADILPSNILWFLVVSCLGSLLAPEVDCLVAVTDLHREDLLYNTVSLAKCLSFLWSSKFGVVGLHLCGSTEAKNNCAFPSVPSVWSGSVCLSHVVFCHCHRLSWRG